MSRASFSIPAAHPSTFRESVLSTRQLSFTTPTTDETTTPTSRKSTLTAIPDSTSVDVQMSSPTSSYAPCLSSTPPPLSSTVASSPLFRLPRELRLQIYTYLLSSHPLGINFPSPHLDRNLTPALLRTASPLLAETLPVLYGNNRFIFSHPSDANVFSHAYADADAVRTYTSELILRVKNSDAKLWTSYFNSNDGRRSLVQDFPALKRVTVRFRGPRYVGHLSAEDNAMAWLREKALVEVVTSVRKCAVEVFVEVCVKVPEGWRGDAFERALEAVVRGNVRARRERGEEVVPEEGEGVVRRRDRRGNLGWEGVWVKVETEGT
ncbi:hypothetical protein KVT40_001743 [Elsinoe batatas]|uniref:F-box domain-containing protein n=1 Tax=Elsinoe batatas TaxID=2601811 RepID=A0A8K0L5K3_9PEZI|nr:hypothetical protein KVT40_001743 [Elsinoe batatas]